MTGRNSKIIAVIFVCMIFILGTSTLLKCKDEFSRMIKEDNISSESAEAVIQEEFKGKNHWINANGLFQRLCGMTIIKDAGETDVYKLKNGQIMYGQGEQDVSDMIDNVKALYEYTQENDIDFLYVQLPFKIKDDEAMPAGTKEFANEQADQFIEAFDKSDIPYLDIRAEAKKNGLEWDDMFFNTDHHWRPATALWSADKICHELSKLYGYNIDTEKFNINNYNIETRKDWFLGSLGKRTGVWYAGVDDFDIITPNFDTEYEFTAVSRDGSRTERTGDFDSALLKHEYLDTRDYFNINTYAGYTGGDYALNKVINRCAPNSEKLLLIRDSFSCALLPFMTMGAEEITTVDLRHYKDMPLIEYIKQNYFDAVIIAYNPSAFSQEQFSFFE